MIKEFVWAAMMAGGLAPAVVAQVAPIAPMKDYPIRPVR